MMKIYTLLTTLDLHFVFLCILPLWSLKSDTTFSLSLEFYDFLAEKMSLFNWKLLILLLFKKVLRHPGKNRENVCKFVLQEFLVFFILNA